MKKLAIIAIFVVALLGGGFIGFIITGFATSGSTKDSFDFYYEPSSPSHFEDLLVNVDIGEVEIQYNETNTPYYVKIEVSIVVSGLFMTGKTYLDFFKPYTEWWDNITSPTIFNMNLKPNIWFDPSHWFKSYNVSVKITLRTDVVYNLNVISSIGSIDMWSQESVILNNTILSTSTGSIYFITNNTHFSGNVNIATSTGSITMITKYTNYTNGLYVATSTGSLDLLFLNCTMGDDIIGIVSTGNILFSSYNMIYVKDSLVQMETSTGNIRVVLNQYLEMNANITGIIHTSTGNVEMRYYDFNEYVGVKFTSSSSTGSIEYDYSPLEFSKVGNELISLNYNNAYVDKYAFSLSTSTGNIAVIAESYL